MEILVGFAGISVGSGMFCWGGGESCHEGSVSLMIESFCMMREWTFRSWMSFVEYALTERGILSISVYITSVPMERERERERASAVGIKKRGFPLCCNLVTRQSGRHV